MATGVIEIGHRAGVGGARNDEHPRLHVFKPELLEELWSAWFFKAMIEDHDVEVVVGHELRIFHKRRDRSNIRVRHLSLNRVNCYLKVSRITFENEYRLPLTTTRDPAHTTSWDVGATNYTAFRR
jgi:hypothetical protein